MQQSELLAVARMLREALGYESREVRIGKIRTSKYLDVRMLANQLTAAGLLQDATVREVMALPSHLPPK